jgi:ABC-type sugar transport system ATPase subunit
MAAPASAAGIEIAGLVKRYGDTWALAGLDLTARPGEILGVAGPNGAGKSTLVKVLASEVAADGGTIDLDGVRWNASTDADRVAVVHQEPQLFGNLTVAENLLVGQEPTRFRRPRGRDADVDVLREVGLLPYADRTVDSLPLALQQRTEIARALSKRADVFLFDEPNSALTEAESAELFERMHALAAQDKVILLVSHRLAELAAHCDRICVIVDGKVRTELAPPNIDEERIARELVVGRAGQAGADRAGRTASDRRLLDVSGWTHRRSRFTDVDLSLRSGEIVAIVGVEGSGGRELVRSVAGFEEARGDFALEGPDGPLGHDAVAYVTGDRSDSLFTNLSVAENLYLRQVGSLTSRAGIVRKRQARAEAQRSREAFYVKTQDLDTPIRSLSGGNQQKVAIAAALAIRPALLALEEPTRGVDLGSKAEIYRLLRDFCSSGAGVLLYCTEDSEVFDAADRVAVMSRGRLVGILDVAEYADAESLAEAIAVRAGTDLVPSHQTPREGKSA